MAVLPDDLLCGIGFVDPYLDIYKSRGQECAVFILPIQELISVTTKHISALVNETALPLSDTSQKRILSAHLLNILSPHTIS